MADKYWVGGGSSTNANATANTNWALTSGGARNAAVPTTGDIIHFDGVSNAGDGHAQDACVWNLAISVASFDFTGYTGTLTGSSAVTITGLIFKLSTGMTCTGNTSTFTFTSTSGTCVLTSNGKTIGSSFTFNGVGGTWQLADAMVNTGTTTLTAGTFDYNSKAFSTAVFSSSNSTTRVISNTGAGAVDWTLTGTGTVLAMAQTTGLTVTWPTNINHNNASATACTWSVSSTGGTARVSSVMKRSAGTGTLAITATSLFKDITLASSTGTTVTGTADMTGNFTGQSSLTSATTLTVVVTGTSGTQTLTIGSTATALNYTINGVGGTGQFQDTTTTTSGAITLTNGTLDMNTKTISIGSFSSSNSNTRVLSNPNTAWTITGTGTVWNTGTTTNLTATWPATITHNNASATACTWTGNSATGGTAAFTSSMSMVRSAGTGTLAITATSFFGKIDLTGSTLTTITGTASLVGAFIGQSSLTSASTLTLNMTGTSGVQNVTMGSTATAMNLTVNNSGTSVQLQDAFTISATSTLTLTAGTLDVNSKALSVGLISASNSNTRAISNPGTTWTLTGTGTVLNFATTTNLTITWPTNIDHNNASATACTWSVSNSAGTVRVSSIMKRSAGTGTLAITGTSLFSSIDLTGYTGTTVTGTINITGAWTGVSALTSATTITITMSGTSGVQNLTMGSTATVINLTVNNSGTSVQLQDNFTTTGNLTLTAGTLDTNLQTTSAATFSSANNNTRGVTNCTTLVLTGTGTVLNVSVGGTFSAWPTNIDHNNSSATACTWTNTLSANRFTGTMKRSAGSGTLAITATGYFTNIDMTGSTVTTVTGTVDLSGTFTGTANLTSASTLLFSYTLTTGSVTPTISTGGANAFAITMNGVGGTLVLGGSTTIGGTLTLTNGTLNVNSQALSVGIFSSNNGNTRVISNPGTTWTLTGTGTVLNISTGAGLTVAWPTNIDHNNASATACTWTGPASGQRVTSIMKRSAGSGTLALTSGTYFRTIDLTGYTGTTVTGATDIDGNFTLTSSQTTATTLAITASKTSGTQTFTSNTASTAIGLTLANSGSTFTLADTYTSTGLLNLTASGIFNINSNNLTAAYLSAGSSSGNITNSGSTWNLKSCNMNGVVSSVSWPTTINIAMDGSVNDASTYTISGCTSNVVITGTTYSSLFSQIYCANIDISGFTETVASFFYLYPTGNMTLGSNAMSACIIYPSGSGTQTLSVDYVGGFNGVINWPTKTAGTIQLTHDYVNAETIDVAGWTLNTNGFALTINNLTSSGTVGLTLGASTITLNRLDVGSGTLTLSAGTSNITVNTPLATDNMGTTKTWYDVKYNISTATGFTGSGNTFHTLQLLGNGTFTMPAATTVTGAFTVTGTSATVRLAIFGTATITAGSVALSNADWHNVTAAGAAIDWTGTSLGNMGGNAHITFTTPVNRYWMAVSGGSWSSTSSWSATSGGATGASVPLPQDSAFINVNSITSGSQTITVDVPYVYCPIDCTGVLHNPTLDFYGYPASVSTYGNLTFNSGITIVASSSSSINLYSGTLVWGGATNSSVALHFLGASIGGDVVLSGTASFVVWGTFSAGAYNITAPTISMAGTVSMGSGTWTQLDGNFAAGGTVNAQTSTLKLIAATAGITLDISGYTFNNVWYAPGSGAYNLSIVGSGNTVLTGYFKDDGTTAHTITFASAYTYTVGAFQVSGHAGQLISLVSDSPGTPVSLICASGTISDDYLSIQDSHASGGASFFAGTHSTNVSGNTGWTFTGSSTTYNQTVTVTNTAAITMVRSTAKIIPIASTTATSRLNSVGKIVSVASTTATSWLKAIARTVAVASTGAVSFLKSIARTVAIAPTTTTTITKARTVVTTVAATCVSATSWLKSVARTVLVTSTGTVSFLKSVARTVLVTSTSAISVALSRTFRITVSATSTGAVAFVKSVGKTAAIASTTATSFLKSITRTVAITSTTSISFLKSVAKTVVAACTGAITVTVSHIFRITVSAASTCAVAFAKSVGKVASITSTTTTTFLKAITRTVAIASTTATTIAKVRTVVTTITAACVSATSWLKSTGKIISVASTTTTSRLKSIARTVAITSTGTVSFLKAIARTVVITSTTATTVSRVRTVVTAVTVACVTATTWLKSVLKVVAIASATATTITKVRTVVTAITVACVSATSWLKSIAKTISIGSVTATTVTKARIIATAIVVSCTSATTRLNSVGKIVAVTSATATSFLKSVGKAIAVSSVGAVIIAATKVGTTLFNVTVTVASTGAVSLQKSVGKIAAVTSSGAVSFAKSITKTISATISGTVSRLKSVGKIAAVTSSGTVSIAKSITKTILATIIGAVSLQKAVVRIVSVASTGTVSVVKSITKTIAATAIGTVSSIKSVAKIVSATCSGSVTMTRFRRVVVVILATLAGAVSLIVSGTHTTYTVLVSVAVATSTTVRKRIAKTVSVVSTTLTKWLSRFIKKANPESQARASRNLASARSGGNEASARSANNDASPRTDDNEPKPKPNDWPAAPREV